MTEIKYGGLLWPPLQMAGLNKRKPELKTKGKPTRARWSEHSPQYCNDALAAAWRYFEHTPEPEGVDEWGDEEVERRWSNYLKDFIDVIKGDCDEATPLAMIQLKARGFPMRAQRIAIGRTPRGPHTVAVVDVIKTSGRRDAIYCDHRHGKWWFYGDGPTGPGGDLRLWAASVPGSFLWTRIIN